MQEQPTVAATPRGKLGSLVEAARELDLVVRVGTPERLSANVTSVHVTELLRPGAYLRAGEVVCTEGAQLLDDDACAAFVADLVDAGAAALCLGLGEVHAEAPSALVDACGRAELPMLTLPRGARFLALDEYLAQQWHTTTVRRERLGQLFELVADGSADGKVLARELAASGITAFPTLTVSAWEAGLADRLLEELPVAVVACSAEATYLITDRVDPVLACADRFALPCGHSSGQPQELARILVEARAAMRVALSRGEAIGPQQLTNLESLLFQLPSTRLTPFVTQLLLPLESYDRRRRTGLVDTLRHFLGANGSVEATARAEFLHVNTVRNRLKTIAATTGRDPLDFDSRVAFEIALWAYDRARRSPHPEHASL